MQSAAAMGFCATKHQGKTTQPLAPLFMGMTSGIHRLAEQSSHDKHTSEARESVGVVQPDADADADALELGYNWHLAPLSMRPHRE